MSTNSEIFAAVGVVIVLVGFTLLAAMMRRLTHTINVSAKKREDEANRALSEVAREESSHLFNKEFREELRNHGRLQFEDIINKNAMFLKQDLDMTIAQLNEYLKQQIGGKMNDEFADYTKAMDDARQLAMSSLQKSANAVEEQQHALTESLNKVVSEREATMLKAFEENMSKIIEHYIMQALGDQFNLKEQLPYIIQQMEDNKQAIMEDMRL
jgi:hypothetical protein